MANKRPWEALDDLLIVKPGRVQILMILLILISGVGASAQSPRDAEIVDLLKKLNKQPIKTLQSPDGEIIDCIDIYKQPAFDHPLLKNHTIEMRPSFDPGMVDRSNYSSEYAEPIWRQNGSCSEGTIPIRRVRASDLLRAESLDSFGTVHPNPYTATNGRLEKAGATMQTHSQPFYNGVGGDLSVWKPWVRMTEMTTSAIGIECVNNVCGENFIYTIHAGWGVVSHTFGDDNPRSIVSWMAKEGNHIKGCINLLCSGFIQVNNAFVLGSPLPFSGIRSPLSILRLKIHKTILDNWWVRINGLDVGYFPSEIFPNFNQATTVVWIGEVFNKMESGHHTTTQMGSGRFPSEGYGRAAHFENMVYSNHFDNFMPAQDPYIDVSFPRCYNAILRPLRTETTGTNLLYGGLGGKRCDLEPRG